MHRLTEQVVGDGVITLIITLGEGGGLTDDRYLVNILTLFIRVLIPLCFVAAATCVTGHY